MPLSDEQQRTRGAVEGLIGLAAPFLDAVLRIGEWISRRAEPTDHEHYPVRSLAEADHEPVPGSTARGDGSGAGPPGSSLG